MICLIMLLFALSDYVLYNRSFGNPLMVFCILVSLTAYLTAALFPHDKDVSKLVIAAGMVTWSIMVFRILAYEWDERYSGTVREPEIRTVLRRFVITVWATLTCFTSLLYVSELVESSWLAIRAQFVYASATDLFHTAFIHSLYFTDPDKQPTVPFKHTGGMRVGPPPLEVYIPTLYILAMAYFLTPEVRASISRMSGAAQLSIALGQVRAGEVPELPTPPRDTRRGSSSTNQTDSASAVSGDARSGDEPQPGGSARGAAAGDATRDDGANSAHSDGAQPDLRTLQRQLRQIEDARHRVLQRINTRLTSLERASVGSVGGSSSYSELDALVGRAAPTQSALDPVALGVVAAGPLDPAAQAAFVLPTYHLMPAFFKEEHEVNYITSSEERMAFRLRVDASGRLVDAAGQPLAPSAEQAAIFVLESSGALLLTLDWLTSDKRDEGGVRRKHRYHSSLVAGQPVSAAGMMHVKDGRLLLLSNESGHYAPPPSCLAHVMSRLAGLGVANLESVQMEHVSTPLTQPEAQPVASAAARAKHEGGVSEPLEALKPRPQHATNEESTGRARRRAAARSPNGSEDAMSTTSSVGSWPWRRRRAP